MMTEAYPSLRPTDVLRMRADVTYVLLEAKAYLRERASAMTAGEPLTREEKQERLCGGIDTLSRFLQGNME